ncbi:MAG: hypothetical protein N3G76_01425 [Candidatus Micrarchaeota archaeon]|nr:hypothetical protein [Candidatus Micrarchaeota archaeon]
MMGKGSQNVGIYALGMIAVVLIAVGAYLYVQWDEQNRYGGELTLSSKLLSTYEGNFKIANGQRIAIVMDVRGLGQDNKVSVYQCGVGFASSLARLGKNVTNFAIEDSGCYGPLNRTSITACNEVMHKEDYIILLKGGEADTKYYEDHLLVIVPPNNTIECGVKAR